MSESELNMLAAASAGVAALLCSVLALLAMKRIVTVKATVTELESEVVELRSEPARTREMCSAAGNRLTEHGRQLVWAQAKLRKMEAAEIHHDENEFIDAPRLSITERRHRVMKLSERGQNVESIAETLAMLPGEVELIMNLNRAAMTASVR